MSTKGNVKKFKKNKGHESISRNMLQDEDNLSIESIGLLSNLLSYPDNWKLYKTELYTRFKKSKRTKIQSAWNELVEERYIVQLRKRIGKKYNYIYYFQEERFTDEDIKEICVLEQAQLWDGKLGENQSQNADTKGDFSTVDFQQSKMNSPKSTPNIITRKEVNYKNKIIKEDTYKDTDTVFLPQAQLDREQDQLLKESLKQDLPPTTFKTLAILSKNYDEMYNWVGIIFRAKKQVEEKYNKLLSIEMIDEELNSMLLPGIRHIKKNTKIDKKDNYLFTTIYNGLEKYLIDLYSGEETRTS